MVEIGLLRIVTKDVKEIVFNLIYYREGLEWPLKFANKIYCINDNQLRIS